ncbi:hypothetical protein [Cytobacillus oceanisediminis]|uniref:hypothetical protein n=1 Tax=Cytobacillus oceanisediminis TaxID=665099 RepID=UPI001FB410AB|nr:hypothetical protein [Cytobacillus oceanisediminis]UOE58250.1 hypothetical protein IRB79_27425 [Cytobacillus oceanisediminis]
MYTDYEIRKRVEQERQRIIELLKEKGITQNSEGEGIEDLPLLPLTLMENKLVMTLMENDLLEDIKVRVGCSVKDYFAGKGDTVLASWSIEWSGFTVGSPYKIKGISPSKNLIIENDNGNTSQYDPVHFSPVMAIPDNFR